MHRFVGLVGALVVALLLLAPAVLAADPLGHTGRVLISTEGDLTLPAGDQADLVVVVRGTATIAGQANTIVVVDGALNLLGARTETVFAVRSPVEVGQDTIVLGDVFQLDSLVHQTGNAEIGGQVSDLSNVLINIGAVLAPAIILLWIGFGLATIVAGLVLAGLAARQVRDAEAVISHEPVLALVTGIVGVVAFPIVAVILIATIIGAPLGVGILLGAWPLVGFVGYLVAGIWIGDWVLRRGQNQATFAERPYLAAIIGLLILEAISIIPFLAIISAIASLFGFGAVILLALRVLRTHQAPQPTVPGPMPAPLAG